MMAVQPDTSSFVHDAWEAFSWRMMSNYVSPWERDKLHSEINSWSEWCSRWSARAEAHVKRGDEAAAAGHPETAGYAFVTAALFYHWASFLFVEDLGQFRSALEGAESAFAKAAPLLPYSMEILNIPFEGTHLRGYLRKPEASGRWPLVVLIPGADSTKEELFDLGEHILRRGFAVYCFDGPGHGLVTFDLKLRPDYEVPIGAALDHLTGREDIDPDRIALGGISYGGQFAIRGAALDGRAKAAVSISSWYSAAGRFPNQRPVSKTALQQYMGPDPGAVQNTMTLDGVADRLKAPLLQVYGGLDPASPPSQAEQTEKAVSGPTTLKVFEDGVHVCNNVWYEARPFVADWLADTIQPGPR